MTGGEKGGEGWKEEEEELQKHGEEGGEGMGEVSFSPHSCQNLEYQFCEVR